MNDDGKNVAKILLWVATVATVTITRLPGQGTDATIIVLVGAVAVLTLASMSLFWAKAPASLRGWLLLASLALFLVPASSKALTPWMPAWTVAILYVATLHVFFQDHSTHAPAIESPGTQVKSPFLRYLPVVGLSAAVVVLPFLLPLLPARIAAAFELQTALEPLVPLAILAIVLLAVAFLRIALDPQAEDADEEDDDAVPSRPSRAATKEVEAA